MQARSQVRRIVLLSTSWLSLASAFLAIPGRCHSASRSRDHAVEVYLENKLDEALPLLVRDARARPEATRLAWLADAYRRLGRHREADSTARLALILRPCHAFAHQVLSDNFLPQYGDWPSADADSAWSHAIAAARCDSTDGNGWLSVWIQSLARGEREWEGRALRGLHDSGFFARAVMSYNRWMLRDLPENAVLIVNGDVDTYPAHILQAFEKTRPDVAIVNLSLLETDWYRRRVRDQYRVKMPFDAAALDRLEPQRGADGEWVFAAQRVLSGWMGMVESGALDRPLAISATVPDPGRDTDRRVVNQGAFWLVQPDTTATAIDTVRVRASLTGIRGADFIGPWVSAQDRSPIRNSATSGLVDNVFVSAAYYFKACSEAGNTREAEAMQKWAARFASESKAGAATRSRVRDMKRHLQENGRP